jgi:hypothetical protein
MDLPETPSTAEELQAEVRTIVLELQSFVDNHGVFEMTSQISKNRRGAKVEIAFWSPVGEYCQCPGPSNTCKELQHGKFPFRDILHRVQSDVTLEFFRSFMENEKKFLKENFKKN